MFIKNTERDYVLEVSYELDEEDIRYLEANPIEEGDDWYKSKYKFIKDKIRNFLETNQPQFCPFCRTKLEIHGSNYYNHIEHLVSKSNKIKFMFKGNNLVLSCPCCNSKKNQSDTLVDSSTEFYPLNSGGFNIVHPYFDKFSDYIFYDEADGFKAVDGNNKGSNTIGAYSLNRIKLREKLEKDILNKSNTSSTAQDVLNLINTMDKEEQDKLIASIKDKIL